MEYTVEIYKLDKRKKAGERLEHKVEYKDVDYATLYSGAAIMWPATRGFRVEIHETYVTRRNLMDGTEFTERYDTPSYCSPSSETYWSM